MLLNVACGKAEVARCGCADRCFHLRPGLFGAADAAGNDGSKHRIDGGDVFILVKAAAFHSHDVAVLVLSQEDERIRANVSIRPNVLQLVQKIIREKDSRKLRDHQVQGTEFLKVQSGKAAVLRQSAVQRASCP